MVGPSPKDCLAVIIKGDRAQDASTRIVATFEDAGKEWLNILDEQVKKGWIITEITITDSNADLENACRETVRMN